MKLKLQLKLKISELGYKKAKFDETKAAQEEFNAKKAKEEKPDTINLRPQANSNTAESKPDPKAEEWAANNSWFGTRYGYDLHCF